MIAQKTLCDTCLSARSWEIVVQGRYPLSDLNQMERELLQCLRWSVNISSQELAEMEVSFADRSRLWSLTS